MTPARQAWKWFLSAVTFAGLFLLPAVSRGAVVPAESPDDLVRETAAFYARLAKQSRQTPSPTRVYSKREEASSPAAAGVAESALRYLGLPYRWGGESPRGLDCSGLVRRVLAEFAVKAPHSAALQANLGRPVELSSLQAGDLVFFTSPGHAIGRFAGANKEKRISHVGIFLGEGQFLHSSQGAGKVIISSLYEPRFRRTLAGARRLEAIPPDRKEFALPAWKGLP